MRTIALAVGAALAAFAIGGLECRGGLVPREVAGAMPRKADRQSERIEPAMPQRRLLGMLTPSSNTVLEPLVSALLSELPEVTAHFGRFRVTEISLDDSALGQFDLEPMLSAARLLADARVEVIAWNGTSAGWMGFEADERLCTRITRETGVPAASSVLALNEALALTGVRRLGLVSPYIDEIQARIIANYATAGIDCVAERARRKSE